MLCVPVECRATSKVVALACAFNKKGAHKWVLLPLDAFKRTNDIH